jgi:pseudouridine-5'-phosphate glycosidase
MIASGSDVAKLGPRDLPAIVALGKTGATTVASTSVIAQSVGIKLFATGGLGGVHRDANQTYDESTDLTTLGNTPIAVVSAGVKSILDVPATLERLETLGVLVLGFQTKKFPGFYLTDSGYDLEWQVDSSLAIAKILKLHEQILTAGLVAAKQAGITGKQATPFLLEFFHRETKGESLRVNIDVVRSNARLAAQIAVKLSELK